MLLSLCLRAYLRNYMPNLHGIFNAQLPMAMSQFYTGSGAIHHALPVLWMTSYLLSEPYVGMSILVAVAVSEVFELSCAG